MTSLSCLRVALLLLGLAGLVSCAQVLGVEDTELVQGDSNPNLPVNFACVGKQPTTQPSGDTAIITIKTSDLSGTPLSGITVKACPSSIDPTCNSPVVQGASDSEGNLTLKVPTSKTTVNPKGGFNGYLDILGPSTGDPLRPLLWFFSEPIFDSFDLPVFMIPQAVWETLATPQVSVRDPNRGDLFLEFRDCGDKTASGVSFFVSTQDEQSSPVLYFSKDGNFTKDLQSTDEAGRGGMFGLPTGPAVIRIRPSGARVDSSSVTIFFRAGTNSTGFFRPNL